MHLCMIIAVKSPYIKREFISEYFLDQLWLMPSGDEAKCVIPKIYEHAHAQKIMSQNEYLDFDYYKGFIIFILYVSIVKFLFLVRCRLSFDNSMTCPFQNMNFIPLWPFFARSTCVLRVLLANFSSVSVRRQS